ncbi:MAG: zinc ribbon domain-containing protein [Candidatus Cloacimonetes bacterium]|nr:zinc ribbon domain-containing protein [Candidatus Cloacimonadota bacterium]
MLKPCPRCNQDTESDDKFCGTCGFLLRKDSDLKPDDVFAPKQEQKKVFSLEDDPTESQSVTEEIPETKAKKLDLATKLKVKSKSQTQVLKRALASFKSFIALIIWLGICTLSSLVAYLMVTSGIEPLSLPIVLSSLSLLIPALYWFALKNKGFVISEAHYPALCFIILSICSYKIMNPLPDELLFLMSLIVFMHLAFHLVFSIRLFWFLRLAFMLIFLPAYLDLLWQISQKVPVAEFASATHPVAQNLLPWLDQAGSYLIPVWILIHLLLPLIVFVSCVSIFINLYQREFYVANQRFMMSLVCIGMILAFHTVFVGFQFSVHSLFVPS